MTLQLIHYTYIFCCYLKLLTKSICISVCLRTLEWHDAGGLFKQSTFNLMLHNLWLKGLLPDVLFLLLRFLFQISPDLKHKKFSKIIKTLFPTWFTPFHFSFTADFYGAINDVRCSDNWNFDLYMLRKRLFREQFFMQISRQTMRTALSYIIRNLI